MLSVNKLWVVDAIRPRTPHAESSSPTHPVLQMEPCFESTCARPIIDITHAASMPVIRQRVRTVQSGVWGNSIMPTSSHSQVSTGRRNIKEVDTVSGCEAKETRSLSNAMEEPGKAHTTTSVQRPVWISSRGGGSEHRISGRFDDNDIGLYTLDDERHRPRKPPNRP